MLGTSKNIWGFDPRSVPGCALWLDAADASQVTFSSSTNVNTWIDKSGFNNNCSNQSLGSTITYPGTKVNGLNTVNFTAGCIRGAFNSSSVINTTDVTIFIVTVETAPNNNLRMFSLTTAANYQDDTANTMLVYCAPGNYQLTFYRAGAMPTPYTVTQNVPFIYSLTQTSGTGSMWLNGGSNTTASITTSAFAVTNYNIGTQYLANQNYTGLMCEILVYNSLLTTSQRQQVEGYLSHKWGLNGYYDSSIPLTIPGCQLWLDAADSSTITLGTGSSVASWRDKVNGYAVANSSAAYRPIYSQGTIRFTGSTNPSYLDIPTLTIGSSAFSIFFVIQNTGPASGNGSVPIFFWPLSGNGSGALSMTGWLDINNQGVNTNISSTLLKNQYYVISYTFGVTTNFEQVYVNGASIGTYQKSSGYSASLYRLGTIDSSQTTLLSDGNIGEMLVYNTALTTSQRQSIEGYLARKWGLTSMYSALPSIHPFSSIRPHLRTFQPSDIPGCQLWLDAADSSSLVLSGSNVTQWSDKSGNGYNMNTLTPTAGWTGSAAYPTIGTSINGLQTVNFVAQSGLKQATTLDGVKNLFWVGRIAAAVGSTSGGFANFFLLGHDTHYDWHPPIGEKFILSGVAQSGIADASPASLFTNDPNAVTNTVFSSINLPSPPNVSLLSVAGITGTTRYQGICYDRQTHTGWCGDLAEVLIFNTALTTSQRQQVEGYLAHKWGLTPSFFTPLSIPGCKIWFDAFDASYTTSGTTVTAWTNKTGNANASTGGGTVSIGQASLNGKSSVRFPAGTNYLTVGAQTYSTSYRNVFFVVTVGPAGSNYWYLNCNDSICGQCYSWQDLPGDIEINRSGANGLVTNNPSGFFSSTSVVSICTSSGGNTGIWVNGVSQTLAANNVGTGSFWSTGTTSTTITLGGENGRTTGRLDVYELLQYDGSLTSAQRQQIEGYLSQKWGLGVSSYPPSSHPFYKIPPAIAAHFSPTDITGCQLWLDGADSNTVTGTTSVTAWRDKSGNGYVANSFVNSVPNPSWVSNVQNGNGVIQYSAGNGSSIANFVLAQTMSIFKVYYPINQSTGSPFIEHGPNVNNESGFYFHAQGGQNFAIRNESGQVPVNPVNFGNTTISNTWQMIQGINPDPSNSNAMTFYLNGTVKASSATTGSGTSILTKTLYINGRGGANNLSYNTYLAELIIYNIGVTTVQRQQVEGYLAHKWGLTSSLPSKHPYKPSPPIFPPNLFFPTPSMYSALFNSGSLSVPANAALTLGTNNHTFEFWLYQTSRNFYDVPFIYGNTAGNATNNYYMNLGQYTAVLIGNGAGGWSLNMGGGVSLPALNTWSHYALVRNGTTFTLYLNGTNVASATLSISIPAQGGVMAIGGLNSGGNTISGYMTNFRFVNGTAVYTSNFTPPTTPLTAIPNTQVLIQGLVDRGPNAFTVTSTGGVTLSTSVSPF